MSQSLLFCSNEHCHNETTECSCEAPIAMKRPVVFPREDTATRQPLARGRLSCLCFQCAMKEAGGTPEAERKLWQLIREELSARPRMIALAGVKTYHGGDLSGLTFPRSVFFGCDLRVSDFSRCNCSDSWFLGTDLDQSSFANGTLPRTVFVGSRADFAVLSNADMHDVIAGTEEGYLVNWRHYLTSSRPNWVDNDCYSSAQRDVTYHLLEVAAKLVRSRESEKEDRVASLQCRESVFTASNLANARMMGCIAPGSGFSSCRLQGCDFRNAHLDDSSFNTVSLGNTRFDHARLARTDFTHAFTPDYGEGAADKVSLHGAHIENARFGEAFLLEADLRDVHAQFLDASSAVFGPASILSGDFRNTRFVHAEFVACDLGEQSRPIDLRDADFSHAVFTEARLHVSDISSALFDRVRFQKREKLARPLVQTCAAGGVGCESRNQKMRRRLEIRVPGLRENRIIGCATTDDPNRDTYITPPALSLEGATLGEMEIRNISFLTANFDNTDLQLTPDSICYFNSCSFANAKVHFPRHALTTQQPQCQFLACTFTNAVLVDPAPERRIWGPANEVSGTVPAGSPAPVHTVDTLWSHVVLFLNCAFSSTVFVDGRSRQPAEPRPTLWAGNVAFVECTFEQTPLDRDFADLDKVVLLRCRLLDPQYFGYLDRRKLMARRDTEDQTVDVLEGILESTLKDEVVDHTTSPNRGGGQSGRPSREVEDIEYADRQYMWTMFAENFRRLALPNIESRCLASLRDVDFGPRVTDKSGDKHAPVPGHPRWGWARSATATALVASVALAAGGATGGKWGTWSDAHQWPCGGFSKGAVAALAMVLTVIFITGPVSWVGRTLRLRREMRRGASVRRRTVCSWLSDSWKARFSKAIYHYGEYPIHAFIAWIGVIVVFAVFYWGSGILATMSDFGVGNQFDVFNASDQKSIFSYNTARAFANSLYFSAATFTTAGGDLQPHHLTKFFAGLEACIGAVLMALFVLSFARRTAAK